jgi:hypothetical protein
MKRGPLAAALGVLALGLAWWSLRAPPRVPEPEPVDAPESETLAPVGELPSRAPRSTQAPPPSAVAAPSAPEIEEEHAAPGPAPWAHGLDLPPPAPPTELPPLDPAIESYRERAEHVPAETQMAYVRNSIHLLDQNIAAMEHDRDVAGATSEEGQRLETRLTRLRQSRTAREAELAALTQIAAEHPSAEPPASVTAPREPEHVAP